MNSDLVDFFSEGEVHPVFLSVVCVVQNDETNLKSILENIIHFLKKQVSDFELIVVDNGSHDQSIFKLKQLTKSDGLPNLQVYCLMQEVSFDEAAWAGIENALGDFVAVFNPKIDDIQVMKIMLSHAMKECDVVYAKNKIVADAGFFYRIGHRVFNLFYRKMTGLKLSEDAPSYRLMSRRVVNFILQYKCPYRLYRVLPFKAGFS